MWGHIQNFYLAKLLEWHEALCLPAFLRRCYRIREIINGIKVVLSYWKGDSERSQSYSRRAQFCTYTAKMFLGEGVPQSQFSLKFCIYHFKLLFTNFQYPSLKKSTIIRKKFWISEYPASIQPEWLVDKLQNPHPISLSWIINVLY